jgi:NAD(P)-dependent dehydrogenase (short-subunit alcohol dehydrogenase family)
VRQTAQYSDLQGKRVLITGGGSGIGAAITAAFVRQNARVVFIDVAQEASHALAEKLEKEAANKPLFLYCDLRDIGALRAAVEQARAALGDFGILVNNAGNDDRHRLEDVTPEYWDERMAINQRPYFFSIQAVFPHMKRLGGGSIINLGSIVWRLKQSGLPAYSVAKASVHGLTRSLAREFGAFGIRLNTVSPGAVWTDRQMRLWYNAEVEREIMSGQCLRERIHPEDVAELVLFLGSDASSKCTAQEFIVDAGYS